MQIGEAVAEPSSVRPSVAIGAVSPERRATATPIATTR